MELTEARAILERTPRLLDAWLRGLPEAWTTVAEGPATWSAYDIVGHLVHGERTDWIVRAQHLLEHGTARAFEPFDRFAQMAGDRDPPVETLHERLDLFAELRAANLDVLDALALKPGQLAQLGQHPEFGQVTLEQLLATWTVHDLGHLAQIARVMAGRWTDEVGPWAAYLPILRK